ncbi:MAG TPA: nucleotidyltransferase family protein, partial [Caulobacter sp.]|nr:nucleotidyltransferase family protein [Caulobacter sp.]
ELRLLVACTAWPPGPARTTAITAAVDDPALDWERVLIAVDRHRVAGFVHHGLTAAAAGGAPATREAIRGRAAGDALLNLRLLGEALRLVALLTEAAIPVQVLKGPGLMVEAYGDLTVRQSRDLDLLVPLEHVRRAADICERAGYAPLPPTAHEPDPAMSLWLAWKKDFVFLAPATGVLLELHFRPTYSPLLSDRLDLLAETREIAVAPGRTAPVPTRDALYAYLCVHGARHAWFRLKWLGDIAALTAGMPDPEIADLHAMASARGAGRASGQALLLLEAVYGRSLAAALRRELLGDPRVARLFRFGLRAITDPREPSTVPGASLKFFLHGLLLDNSWAFRMHETRAWLLLWPLIDAVPLPRPLWFLYLLLAGPLRLTEKVAGLMRIGDHRS